ncbi:MAG TPA: PIN domain-containing protein, partial [Longimicrobium sp.]|nr:PIN domain-containing protein [Longimicrobium sp.]
MRFLLDTNVLSEPVSARPDARVSTWMDEQPAEEFAISVASFAEIWKGIVPLGHGRRRALLTRWVDSLPDQFSGRVLSVDAAISSEWGRLTAEVKAKGRSTDFVDLLLVATALVLGLTIVTRNVRH